MPFQFAITISHRIEIVEIITNIGKCVGGLTEQFEGRGDSIKKHLTHCRNARIVLRNNS